MWPYPKPRDLCAAVAVVHALVATVSLEEVDSKHLARDTAAARAGLVHGLGIGGEVPVLQVGDSPVGLGAAGLTRARVAHLRAAIQGLVWELLQQRDQAEAVGSAAAVLGVALGSDRARSATVGPRIKGAGCLLGDGSSMGFGSPTPDLYNISVWQGVRVEDFQIWVDLAGGDGSDGGGEGTGGSQEEKGDVLGKHI